MQHASLAARASGCRCPHACSRRKKQKVGAGGKEIGWCMPRFTSCSRLLCTWARQRPRLHVLALLLLLLASAAPLQLQPITDGALADLRSWAAPGCDEDGASSAAWATCDGSDDRADDEGVECLCQDLGMQHGSAHAPPLHAHGRLTEIIFPRVYARTYYAHPRARVMSFSARERGAGATEACVPVCVFGTAGPLLCHMSPPPLSHVTCRIIHHHDVTCHSSQSVQCACVR